MLWRGATPGFGRGVSSPAKRTVTIRMHAGDMTFAQGVEFFEKERYQPHANAVRETMRGTRDPTYLVYTLGKLQILKLRDDYRRKTGAAFRLQDFHDAFLRQGFPCAARTSRARAGRRAPIHRGGVTSVLQIGGTTSRRRS